MDVPDSATATLLCVPSVSSADRTVCADLLTRSADDAPYVLHVDFVRRPQERIRDWQRLDASPAELAVLDIDTHPRSAKSRSATDEVDVPSVVVETVENPSDLTGLGVAFTKCLDRWEDEQPVRVCFHSISALHHYVDLSSAFQFLNVVRGQLSNHGATGHFHIQPGAHEEQTVSKLAPLFDAIVETDLDGDVQVTAR